MSALLDVVDLSATFNGEKRHMFAAPTAIRALRGVSLSVNAGETLAIVGESGSGKSTMARAITRLVPSSGSVHFDGKPLGRDRREMFNVRRNMQMIFQDPYSSLNRRMKIVDILLEPLRVHGIGTKSERLTRVSELMQQVGLSQDMLSLYPTSSSGGQRQRIAIARALALQPRLVICDEAISALDVSVQAQILNLLGDLKRKYDLAYLFITHDLGVVRRFADRIAVMHAGRIVEMATTDALFKRTLHPYTRALLSAVPHPDRNKTPAPRIPLRGDPVSPLTNPSGCLFAKRCSHFLSGLCDKVDPPLVEHGPAHQVACHRAVDGLPIWKTELHQNLVEADK